HEDGSLEVMATAPLPLELAVAAKAIAHWISTGIPLTLAAPVLGLMLNLDIALVPALVATMLAGTPAISFLGSIGAALTLKARRSGLLLALLVLPLYIPTLIFGISGMGFAGSGQEGFVASLLILLAISLAAVAAAPIAAAAALRLQMS
ncbi:MAG: heme exporter protein CcmB, partial [Hyphomicrobium sp.]|uniref:heme exporter protein CcmB n=1 Tax=Hyphomicrobium sp. TaxID=82 RepID=UPI003D11871A